MAEQLGAGDAQALSEAPTGRTRVRRLPARGRYDWDTLTGVLDAGLVCHVGVVLESGPIVLPMAYGRINHNLYLHGANGNATLRGLAGGAEGCVTVTLIDGLVLARSAFHHSINYRSAVCFGRAEPVTDHDEKRAALTAIVEHLVPGRSADSRPPSAEELRATLVVRFSLDEASVKVRTGPPIDDPADVDLDHWAGVLPLHVVPGEPVADELEAEGRDGAPPPVPGYLGAWPTARPS
jgi:nitroimidazol reductase NimA-like FMN-containing flavoprotein (pyridoxamine 5'-phosphate oxidase superfamily)